MRRFDDRKVLQEDPTVPKSLEKTLRHRNSPAEPIRQLLHRLVQLPVRATEVLQFHIQYRTRAGDEPAAESVPAKAVRKSSAPFSQVE